MIGEGEGEEGICKHDADHEKNKIITDKKNKKDKWGKGE